MKKNEPRKNKDYKARWDEIVKYDNDWDYEYLYRMVMHKLELMLDYFSDEEKTQYMENTDRNKVCDELRDAIALGKLCEDKSDDDPVMEEFEKAHCQCVWGLINPSDNTDIVQVCTVKSDDMSYVDQIEAFQKEHPEFKKYDIHLNRVWDSAENSDKYSEMLQNSLSNNIEDAYKKFFAYIGEHITEWWY